MAVPFFEARCECGQLKARCDGPPDSIVQCHCSDCKRRTGSAFGLGAYYPGHRVDVMGVSKRFIRPTASGGEFIQFFCPHCGTTLYWKTAKHPDGIGVAVGAIEDLPDSRPIRSVFDKDRCGWLPPLDVDTYDMGRDSKKVR